MLIKLSTPIFLVFFTFSLCFTASSFAGKKGSSHDECCEVELSTDELMKDKEFLKEIRAGQSLFRQHCQKCHGASGEGNGPLVTGFKKINLKPANLKKLGKVKKDEVLRAHIQKGIKKMPSWSEVLSEQDTMNIINFIRMMALGKIK